MKKTLFITMLAAALMGGQVYAGEHTPTSLSGGEQSGTKYYGVYVEQGDATGGNVTVSYDAAGADCSEIDVYAGYTVGYGAAAYGNRGTVTGGEIDTLYVGYSYNGEAYGNTAVMTGGTVCTIEAGDAEGREQDAYNNVLIITGGTVSQLSYAGYSEAGEAYGNKAYLVGKGAQNISIFDAQGLTSTYTGSSEGINLFMIGAGYGDNGESDNSIDIYGGGVSVGVMTYFTTLGMHLVDGLDMDAPMITLTMDFSEVNPDFSKFDFTVYGDNVTDWSKFNGKSVTLMQAAAAILGVVDGSEVSIKDADGKVIGTATLSLSNDNKTLCLTNINGSAPGPVPEPTTGTLGLLALAGLCIRRRRK